MYKIFKEINETTFLACEGNSVFLLKKTGFEDVALYEKLKKIKNKNVSAVYGSEVIEGNVYAVCEYVSGKTLSDYVSEKGTLTDDEVKIITVGICNGLSAIHKEGIVHRDINPSNIMITKSGEVKIIDFGISRFVKVGVSSDTQILGTQGYAAPEQFGFHQSSPRTDIYAVGVVINFMKTGCLPGEKLTDGRFKEIVLKCTEIDEANRYQSAESLKMAVLGLRPEKKSFSHYIYKIPGFVKGNKVITGISVIYYILASLMFLGARSTGINAVLGDYIPMILFFFVPYMLMWNIGKWTDKIGLGGEKRKAASIIVRICASVVSVFIGMIFIAAFPPE